jgi:HK97 family phage prohead protease
MLRKQFDATTTTTDQGTFTALVSAWEADREKDIITRTAFDRTIEAWQRSGKNIPLLFEHSTTVVGSVDPQSMLTSKAGLIVAGEVDRSTGEGQQVWRSIKSGVAGFSIGYVSEDRPRKGGGRELFEIDLLEISATSRPMHPATRALGWKSADCPPELVGTAWDPVMADGSPVQTKGAADFVLPSDAEIRKRAKALELAEKRSRPIQIASFEC